MGFFHAQDRHSLAGSLFSSELEDAVVASLSQLHLGWRKLVPTRPEHLLPIQPPQLPIRHSLQPQPPPPIEHGVLHQPRTAQTGDQLVRHQRHHPPLEPPPMHLGGEEFRGGVDVGVGVAEEGEGEFDDAAEEVEFGEHDPADEVLDVVGAVVGPAVGLVLPQEGGGEDALPQQEADLVEELLEEGRGEGGLEAEADAPQFEVLPPLLPARDQLLHDLALVLLEQQLQGVLPHPGVAPPLPQHRAEVVGVDAVDSFDGCRQL